MSVGIQLISHKLIANAVVVVSSSSSGERTNKRVDELPAVGGKPSFDNTLHQLSRSNKPAISTRGSCKNANPRLNGLALEQPLTE
jgi:hypothetical protein